MTSPAVVESIKLALSTYAPPPRLTVSLWADRNRVLSPEASAETGQWMTERAEYQRGIMDAVNDPFIEEIVVMSSAQVGKTEILLNVAGYFIDQDPSPILIVQPTLSMAQTFSKDRLSPMLRDTPCMQGKVKDPRSRDSNNTTLHKTFPGGHITIVGANSASGLASRPIRIALCDEVDRYPLSAGAEGDPVTLAFKRTVTFWNRKRMLFSTPTVRGTSRIEQAYVASDRRRFYVPCPGCGEMQHLKWGQVHWEKDDRGVPRPETAVYVCEKCGMIIGDSDKLWMLRNGEWRAEAEFTGIAGFHLNELYSPWVRFSEIAAAFLEAKKSTETLRVWINTSLGETWEEEGETISDNEIYNRREDYGPLVPEGVGVLTCGVDVQDDRIEAHVDGWGRQEERWSVDFKVFHGSPAKPDVWKDLDAFLNGTYEHENGSRMRIACTCVDSGGHFTKQVYDFCKKRETMRIFAVKGSPTVGAPLVSRPSRSNLGNVKLFSIGTDTAKDIIFARLQIREFGPGYMHYPKDRDEEFFRQLTAEKKIVKYRMGRELREWKKLRARNEVLDMHVYGTAAYAILNPNMDVILERMEKQPVGTEDEGQDTSLAKNINKASKKPQGSFATRWKM